jgi:hypothetical protein
MLILVTYRDDLRAIAVRSGMIAGEFDPPPRSTFDTLKRLPIRIRGDGLHGLRELQRHTNSGDVFETERGTPFTSDALNRLVRRIDERAGSPMQGHQHMRRHACGYALADADTTRGQFRTGSARVLFSTPLAIRN